LGDHADQMIVSQASYELTDATVDSQIITLQASGANVFLNGGSPKFAAQAIRKASDIGWRPQQFLAFVSTSIGAVLKPAGIDKSVGIMSIQFLKDASDPRWADNPGMRQYLAFLKEYQPKANPNDFIVAYGFTQIQTCEQVLGQAGDDLTHENVMRQASNLKDLVLPLLLPGIEINTSPTNFYPITRGATQPLRRHFLAVDWRRAWRVPIVKSFGGGPQHPPPLGHRLSSGPCRHPW
jgi:branched-chain amino acid transport system substrate-binding protein